MEFPFENTIEQVRMRLDETTRMKCGTRDVQHGARDHLAVGRRGFMRDWCLCGIWVEGTTPWAVSDSHVRIFCEHTRMTIRLTKQSNVRAL